MRCKRRLRALARLLRHERSSGRRQAAGEAGCFVDNEAPDGLLGVVGFRRRGRLGDLSWASIVLARRICIVVTAVRFYSRSRKGTCMRPSCSRVCVPSSTCRKITQTHLPPNKTSAKQRCPLHLEIVHLPGIGHGAHVEYEVDEVRHAELEAEGHEDDCGGLRRGVGVERGHA